MNPEIDLIIAVHQQSRPIDRAVRSVLLNPHSPVLVTVVTHNIDQKPIQEKLSEFISDSRLRILEFRDNIDSAAGPFNFGLSSGSAPYTAVLGSDDELEPGALESWLALAHRTNSAAIIPKQRRVSSQSYQTPPTRPFRAVGLHPVKDRLSYRTAQLGLVSRQAFPDLRFATGLGTGEDIIYGLKIWFSGQRISYDRHGPAYLIHDELDPGRATMKQRSLDEEFAFLDEVLEYGHTLHLPERTAIGVKLFRSHLLPAIVVRVREDRFDDNEIQTARRILHQIRNLSPLIDMNFSIIDRDIFQYLESEKNEPDLLNNLVGMRNRFTNLKALLTKHPLDNFRRESPLRFLLATYLGGKA